MYGAIIFLVFATSSTWSKVITDEKPSCSDNEWTCNDGTCINNLRKCNGAMDCPDGSDETALLCNVNIPQSDGRCVLPPFPSNGHYRVSNVPGAVPGQSFFLVGLTITCYPGYALTGSVERLCFAGVWQPTVVTNNECARFCQLNKDPSVRFRCLLTGNSYGSRECNEYEPEGTLVAPECNSPTYYHNGILPNMRCINGQWDYVARCSAGLVKNTTNITTLITDQVEDISGIKDSATGG